MPDPSKYFNQTVTVQRQGTIYDDEGRLQPGSPETFSGAFVERQRRYVNASGEEKMSTAECLLEAELQLGDLIEGKPVEARESLLDAKIGEYVAWRYYL